MGGGLIQLVAYGAQDMFLTGNPQITFFKSVYRRHTNFSIESIKQSLTGTTDFKGKLEGTISRNGDLIHRMYLQMKLPQIDLTDGLSDDYYIAFRWLNWIGHVLIKNVSVTIGGQEIDKHTGEWLHLWNELTQKSEKAEAYAEMVGNVPRLTQIHSAYKATGVTRTPCVIEDYKLYVPLQFWFNRHIGLALPMIALQYHDVTINIELEELENCIWATLQNSSSNYATKTGAAVFADSNTTTTPTLDSVELYVDYIFLDTAERKRFAQVAHEYLIERVQNKSTTTIQSNNNQATLSLKSLSHPVKEIVWVIQANSFIDGEYTQSRAGRQYFNYTDSFDYSNFTGTPETYWGPGMKGGRSPQNLWYGLPTVKVEGLLNQSNAFANSTTGVTDATAGYNDVSDYTPSTGAVNTYENRYMEDLVGPALAQPVVGNSTGLWSATSNNLPILDNGKNPTATAKLVLNGNDRFSQRDGFYFNVVQPYECHTGQCAPGINVYSFSLKPEDYQPSGTCNFSRIDNADLEVTLSTNIQNFTSKARVYALSYNILRVMSGMGGLAYSS